MDEGPTSSKTAQQASDFADQLIFPSDAALKLLTAEQRETVASQKSMVLKQSAALQAILSKQLDLTGRHPLTADTPLQQVAQEIPQQEAPKLEQQQAPIIEGTSPSTPSPTQMPIAPAVNSSSAGKASRLTPEAEQTLLAFFAIQDTLTKEATVHLAEEANCSEAQVREYFTRLRCSLRSFLQKLQRKASGLPVGSHAAPAVPGNPSATPSASAPSIADPTASPAGEEDEVMRDGAATPVVDEQQAKADALREEGMSKLQQCLGGSGVVKRVDSTDALVGIMKAARSWSVKEACLLAIKQTSSHSILHRLVTTVNLLAMLASWAEEAERDEQTSFLRSLLQALLGLSPTRQSLQYTSLPEIATRLQKHRCPLLAELSKRLLQHWGFLEGPAKSPPEARVRSPKAVNPSQMAVPLHKPTQPGRSKAPQPVPAHHRKRPVPEDFLSQDAVLRAKSANRSKVWAAPNKAARLDVSSLADIKGPSRVPAFRPKPQDQLDQQRVHRQYREGQQQLARACEARRPIEASRAAKASQELKVRSIKPQTDPIFPPHHLAEPDTLSMPISHGEDSVESHVQEQRVALQPAARHASFDLVPPSPTEPGEEPPQSSLTSAVQRIPFTPADQQEARDQIVLLRNSGVVLPHLLVLPVNSALSRPLPGPTQIQPQPSASALPSVYYTSHLQQGMAMQSQPPGLQPTFAQPPFMPQPNPQAHSNIVQGTGRTAPNYAPVARSLQAWEHG